MNAWFYISVVIIALLLASNAWLLYRVLYPLRRLSAQTVNLAQGDSAAFQKTCLTATSSWCLRRMSSAGAEEFIMPTAIGKVAIMPGTAITCSKRLGHHGQKTSPFHGCLVNAGTRRKKISV